MVMFEALPHTCCFVACLVVDFPWLSWITWSSLLMCLAFLRVSEFVWHSSKWTHWFDYILQCTSGVEVVACSINKDFIYVTNVYCNCVPHKSWNLMKVEFRKKTALKICSVFFFLNSMLNTSQLALSILLQWQHN